MTLGAALQKAAEKKLQSGWIHLKESVKEPDLESPCLLEYGELNDSSQTAADMGFPVEGLDTETMEDSAEWCRQFEDEPCLPLLLEAFLYYWRFDAWLPYPGAPEPPSLEESQRLQAIEFEQLMGPERDSVRCRAPACERGAIVNSSLCRKHHFELIQKRPYPFD